MVRSKQDFQQRDLPNVVCGAQRVSSLLMCVTRTKARESAQHVATLVRCKGSGRTGSDPNIKHRHTLDLGRDASIATCLCWHSTQYAPSELHVHAIADQWADKIKMKILRDKISFETSARKKSATCFNSSTIYETELGSTPKPALTSGTQNTMVAILQTRHGYLTSSVLGAHGLSRLPAG